MGQVLGVVGDETPYDLASAPIVRKEENEAERYKKYIPDLLTRSKQAEERLCREEPDGAVKVRRSVVLVPDGETSKSRRIIKISKVKKWNRFKFGGVVENLGMIQMIDEFQLPMFIHTERGFGLENSIMVLGRVKCTENRNYEITVPVPICLLPDEAFGGLDVTNYAGPGFDSKRGDEQDAFVAIDSVDARNVRTFNPLACIAMKNILPTEDGFSQVEVSMASVASYVFRVSHSDGKQMEDLCSILRLVTNVNSHQLMSIGSEDFERVKPHESITNSIYQFFPNLFHRILEGDDEFSIERVSTANGTILESFGMTGSQIFSSDNLLYARREGCWTAGGSEGVYFGVERYKIEHVVDYHECPGTNLVSLILNKEGDKIADLLKLFQVTVTINTPSDSYREDLIREVVARLIAADDEMESCEVEVVIDEQPLIVNAESLEEEGSREVKPVAPRTSQGQVNLPLEKYLRLDVPEACDELAETTEGFMLYHKTAGNLGPGTAVSLNVDTAEFKAADGSVALDTTKFMIDVHPPQFGWISIRTIVDSVINISGEVEIVNTLYEYLLSVMMRLNLQGTANLIKYSVNKEEFVVVARIPAAKLTEKLKCRNAKQTNDVIALLKAFDRNPAEDVGYYQFHVNQQIECAFFSPPVDLMSFEYLEQNCVDDIIFLRDNSGLQMMDVTFSEVESPEQRSTSSLVTAEDDGDVIALPSGCGTTWAEVWAFRLLDVDERSDTQTIALFRDARTPFMIVGKPAVVQLIANVAAVALKWNSERGSLLQTAEQAASAVDLYPPVTDVKIQKSTLRCILDLGANRKSVTLQFVKAVETDNIFYSLSNLLDARNRIFGCGSEKVEAPQAQAQPVSPMFSQQVICDAMTKPSKFFVWSRNPEALAVVERATFQLTHPTVSEKIEAFLRLGLEQTSMRSMRSHHESVEKMISKTSHMATLVPNDKIARLQFTKDVSLRSLKALEPIITGDETAIDMSRLVSMSVDIDSITVGNDLVSVTLRGFQPATAFFACVDVLKALVHRNVLVGLNNADAAVYGSIGLDLSDPTVGPDEQLETIPLTGSVTGALFPIAQEVEGTDVFSFYQIPHLQTLRFPGLTGAYRYETDGVRLLSEQLEEEGYIMEFGDALKARLVAHRARRLITGVKTIDLESANVQDQAQVIKLAEQLPPRFNALNADVSGKFSIYWKVGLTEGDTKNAITQAWRIGTFEFEEKRIKLSTEERDLPSLLSFGSAFESKVSELRLEFATRVAKISTKLLDEGKAQNSNVKEIRDGVTIRFNSESAILYIKAGKHAADISAKLRRIMLTCSTSLVLFDAKSKVGKRNGLLADAIAQELVSMSQQIRVLNERRVSITMTGLSGNQHAVIKSLPLRLYLLDSFGQETGDGISLLNVSSAKMVGTDQIDLEFAMPGTVGVFIAAKVVMQSSASAAFREVMESVSSVRRRLESNGWNEGAVNQRRASLLAMKGNQKF